MYASRAFIASESESIFSPWLGFSIHQLIMSRSVAKSEQECRSGCHSRPPLVRPELVGDPWPQDLRLTQRGVRRRLNEDLLTTPHDVLVLDPIIFHADLAPADAVVEIAGVGADHRLGELGHSLRGIGPRPGRR